MNTLRSIMIPLLLICHVEAQDHDPPNVLMIVVDDMNDWIGCLGGHPDAHTPNIDRLAKRGVLFTNAHCAAPVCNPSRVATLTGLRPSTTGIYDNSVKWHEKLTNANSIPQHFKQHGYKVLGGGKVYHHMPGFNRSSDWDTYFHQRFDGHFQAQLHKNLIKPSEFQYPSGFPLNQIEAVRNLGRPPRNAREFDWGPLDKSVEETGDGQMVAWATKQLQSVQTEPFLFIAGIYRPHLPFYAPKEYFELFDRASLQLPKLPSDDISDLPPAAQAMASQRREDLVLLKSEGKYREFIQAYFASVSFADALIGKLLNALESGPSADNTIVVLWSDHGWHFGEKEHLHKMTLWERATRVPFIVSVPKQRRHRGSCNAPVGLIDIFPTLNNLCGLPKLSELDGRDLTPLINNPRFDWRHPAITTHGFNNHAVRSQDWRYIRYANGDEELYDHRTDPNEWTNLATNPEYRDKLGELGAYLPTQNTPSISKTRKP